MVYPDGSEVRYTYDAAGRLAGVADAEGNALATYAYDHDGRMTSHAVGEATKSLSLAMTDPCSCDRFLTCLYRTPHIFCYQLYISGNVLSEIAMQKSAEAIFREFGGQLRMSEAVDYGITPYTLYALRDRGIVELVSRGVYRLADLPPLSDPDLVTVSLRYPSAVVCLVSALSYHGITTQIPHEVSVAVPRSSRLPSLDYPPVRAHRFSNTSYSVGIETHRIDGAAVKVYDREKTVADCFKFRNRIGMDVVLEALRLHRERNGLDLGSLLGYARACRVEKVMQPYLEASL